MTTYSKPIMDRRPALLTRADLLTHTTVLPLEALIERLQAPSKMSRLSKSCVSLHRKLTKRFADAQQDPVAALTSAMHEITHARGANTLHAVIDLDDSWGFGAAVRDIAHDVSSSVNRMIVVRDETPSLETLCRESERGEISINAPYLERVIEYIISPNRLENASRKLAELRLKADEISRLDARRLVVFGFDHLFTQCLMRLNNILALPVSIDGQIHVPVRPNFQSSATASWPSGDQVDEINPYNESMQRTNKSNGSEAAIEGAKSSAGF